MFGEALVIAIVVTLLFAAADVVCNLDRLEKAFNYTIGGAITSVVMLTSIYWLVLYFGLPAHVGYLWGYSWAFWWALFAFIPFAGIWLVRADQYRIKTGDYMPAVLTVCSAVVLMIVLAVQGPGTPHSNDDAKGMAALVHMHEVNKSQYPDSDANHMVVVSEDTAKFETHNAISGASDSSGRNLGSVYQPGPETLEFVNGHLYYLSQLEYSGMRERGQVNDISPGYIAVDAENPEAAPQLKLGYKEVYIPSAWMGNDINRWIYTHGYSGYVIDDPTLEVDDTWKPFYTASLNLPMYGNTAVVPVGAIVVDAQSGDIQRYDLGNVPDWVDRVYSAETAKDMVGWWGMWGKADWQFSGGTNANRLKVSADPILVYTKTGHPAWQMMVTSLNSDTSAAGLVLVDARTGESNLYDLLAGTPIESQVIHTFESTSKNLKGLKATHLALHKIFGVATWVVSYISGGDDQPNGKPFQGIGLLNAADVQGADVVMATSRDDAYSQYRQVIAHPSAQGAPEENKLNKTVRGTIKQVAVQTVGGNTVYYIRLNEQPTTIYKAGYNVSPLLGFASPGDTVVISFIDTGANDSLVDVAGFSDSAIAVSASQTPTASRSPSPSPPATAAASPSPSS